MFLKSIEIQGFKSFPKKTVLEFKNGITGIVGPNGSGKSNIADALRWVLGEQKVKTMRSSKMEDVIFSGTEKRNPLSFAYVAISFDNSDGQLAAADTEIKVARKLYRSGESEYLLNGSCVRLKDVRELFYDTGIGKEGYSIIGQGQIDRILASKSEERRELFDEACGIVKYKKRKAIALKKLENERLDLERVGDMLFELEKRLPALKRHSESACKFLEYKGELKLLDINLFLYEDGQFKEKVSDCERKEEIACAQLKHAKSELEEARAEHEKDTLVLSELDSQIEELSSKIAQANIIKENLTGQINVLKEQISSARESESSYLIRKEELCSSLLSEKTEKFALEEKAEETKKNINVISDQKLDISKKLIEIQNKAALLSEQTEELKALLIENVRRKGEADARLERIRANTEQLEDRKKELAQTVRDFTENSRKQKEYTDSLKVELELQKQKIILLEGDLKEKNHALDEFEAEQESLKKQISLCDINETRTRTRLESARDITERYEGYSTAIKEVMALRPVRSGIIGVVADIIKTTKEYETAVETALGGNIQNIVTDTEATAKYAIEYLKENRLGRATFLPLKAIRARGGFRFEEAFAEEGALGLAKSLVDSDPRYNDLCDFLLGRILVVDNIDNALKIARKYRYSFIIVTLEGELLSRGGAISGGAYKNRSNLLGRRREIEELESELDEIRKTVESSKKRLSILMDKRAAALKEAADASSVLQEEKIYLNTVDINLSRALSDEEKLSCEFESARMESDSALEREEEIKSLCAAAELEIKDNIEENEKLKISITQKQDEISSAKQAEEDILSAERRLDIELSRLKEQQSFLLSSVIRAENSIGSLEKEINSLEASSASSGPDIASKEEEIKQINEALLRADDEITALNVRLATRQDKRQEIKSDGGDFLVLHDELSEKIASLDKEVFRLGQLKEKYEEQAAKAAENLWNEYELTPVKAREFRSDQTKSPAEMKEEISSIKSKIRTLGTINPAAIDEYKEVSERYNFLTAQKNDIEKAEADILKIIKDLDRQMKSTFRSEFAKISEEFSRVFKIMFDGGRGTISLTDEDDILSSDIEINAQPPGKKLQNMMQLSGGEKALTAIVVLFAIQNLKPSPFCILDEIEAALDDSNITRFSGYLSLLSGKIQFIVITHRKGTMEACDRLYGITMQEKGVSSIVSVSLEEAKNSADDEEEVPV